jgi:hypothetical protein
VEWIQLAQDGDKWWTVVNTVMNFRVLAPDNYLKVSSPATRHGDAWGRGGIAPTHS